MFHVKHRERREPQAITRKRLNVSHETFGRVTGAVRERMFHVKHSLGSSAARQKENAPLRRMRGGAFKVTLEAVFYS